MKQITATCASALCQSKVFAIAYGEVDLDGIEL